MHESTTSEDPDDPKPALGPIVGVCPIQAYGPIGGFFGLECQPPITVREISPPDRHGA